VISDLKEIVGFYEIPFRIGQGGSGCCTGWATAVAARWLGCTQPEHTLLLAP